MFIVEAILNLSREFGYVGIIALMTIESSFIPFPSEVVIPPAAYLAHEGQMNIWLVIISGIIGSLIGAIINYWLALSLGRAIAYKLAGGKYAKFLLINEEKLKRAEEYFVRYGWLSTLIGRLIPAIRQLISIPAGFARMNFFSFLVFTAIGSGIWISILAYLGYAFGAKEEVLSRYYHEISWAFLVFGLAFFIVLTYRFIKKNGGKKPNQS